MLTMAVVTSTWMMVGVRRSGGFGPADRGRAASTSPRRSLAADDAIALPGRARGARAPRIARDSVTVLGRTAVYLAFNVLFVITLAFASRSIAGGTTVLSYAYLFASYLVAGTGMALGMSNIPDMTRAARAQLQAVVAGTVPRGFRYAMLIVAPALAGLIASGAPLIHALLPDSLSAAQVGTLRTFTALLIAWTLAALLVNFLLPVLLALGRARLLGALALPLVLMHLAVTAIGSALFGVDGAVGAFCVAPAALAAILLVAGVGREFAGGVAGELIADALRFVGLAAVAFGAGWGLSATLPTGLAQAAVAGVVGCVIYAIGLRVVARPQLEVLLRASVLRPATA
jgi:peptidoglycan biosynthesis protein MviN/MurJ (putative lipid II flippase)